MPNKIIVFDFDETMGSFGEINIFWNAILEVLNIDKKQKKRILFQILDIYPTIFRPLIDDILQFILKQKIKNKCKEVLIYTNNNGPVEWCNYIIEYLNYKTNKNIKTIDKIIKAFIVNGKLREPNRTSIDKSIVDLIKYTKYSKNLEICFIDDQEHKKMIHDNVYYINIIPYKFNMSFEDMIDIYYNKILTNDIINYEEFKQKILKKTKRYNINNNTACDIDNKDMHIHTVISKQIINYMYDFFNLYVSI
jgi:hypothetical protein